MDITCSGTLRRGGVKHQINGEGTAALVIRSAFEASLDFLEAVDRAHNGDDVA